MCVNQKEHLVWDSTTSLRITTATTSNEGKQSEKVRRKGKGKEAKHQSGYKQKSVFTLTSSTRPSVGRRQRDAYSPGVTATVCHPSVRLSAQTADAASTRASLRFIIEWKEQHEAGGNVDLKTGSHPPLMCYRTRYFGLGAGRGTGEVENIHVFSTNRFIWSWY